MFRKAIIGLGAFGGLILLLFWWRRFTQASAPAGQAAHPTYWQPSEPARPVAPAGESATARGTKTLVAGSPEAEGAAGESASAESSAAFAADQNAAASVSAGAAEPAGDAAGDSDAGDSDAGDAAGDSDAGDSDAGAEGATLADSEDHAETAAPPAEDTAGAAQSEPAPDQASAGAEDAAQADTEDHAETAAPVADDLIAIEGIGPKISTIVAAAGITSFAQLADTDVEKLTEILRDAKLPTANPSTWPDQARLAAEGKFDELKELQDRIRNGKLES